MLSLKEFVDRTTNITDPSRSEYERRQKEKHYVVITGYKDKWLDVEHKDYDRAFRLADYKEGEDVAVYESFSKGSLKLGDGTTVVLTTEDAKLINDTFLKSGMSKDKIAEVKEDIKRSKKNLEFSIEFAKSVKGE